MFPLEGLYFAAYVLSVAGVIAGIRTVARSLWDGPRGEWAATFAVVGVFAHRHVAGGIENMDPNFLPRVASAGPLLFALAYGARGKYRLGLGLCGLVFLFHATTAAHTAALIGCAALCGDRRSVRDLFIGSGLFLLAASPLLLVAAASKGSGIPTPAPMEWLASVKLHYPFHHFAPPGEVAKKAVPAMLACLLAAVTSKDSTRRRLIAGTLAGTALLMAAGWLGNRWLHTPITIHLHLFQVGRPLDALAVVSLGGWSYWAFTRSRLGGGAAVLVTFAYLARNRFNEWFIEDTILLGIALFATLVAEARRGDIAPFRHLPNESHDFEASGGPLRCPRRT